MAFLIFSKNGPEDAFLLGDNQVIIGRAPDCGLTIKSNKLSRKHCKIYPGKNVYIIEDLGSANGTLVNGKKITEATNLNQGDIIRIGDTVAHFSWHPNLELKKETTSESTPEIPVVYPALKLVSAPKDTDLPKEFTLKPGVYKVGRKPGNDILINFKSVSGNHCKITVEADAIYIEDLGSTNGTKINGKKISEKTKITDSDEVQFEKLNYKVDWPAKRTKKQASTQDDILFVEDDKKAEPKEEKLTFIDDDDDEIKFDEPDDINFEIDFDDQATDDQRQQAMKMFEETGHSEQIDIAESGSIEEQLNKEVQEFLDEGTNKKRGMKSYTILFFEIAFVLSAIIVGLILILQDNTQPGDVTTNFRLPAPSDSLIDKNWSFELGVENPDEDLQDWVANVSDSDYVYQELADTVKSGRACLRIDRNDQTLRQSEIYYAHPISIKGGATYQLNYWAKNVENSGAAILKVAYFSDEKGTNESFLKNEIIGDCVRSTNQEWREVSAITTAPNDAKSVRIALSVFGGESVFQFDDVTMKASSTVKQAPPEVIEIQFGKYKASLNSMGMFSVYNDTEDEPEYIIQDFYGVLHHQKTTDPVSLIYFTKNLNISKVAGSTNELQCDGVLLDPLGEQAGAELPYFINLKVTDNSTINIRLKFEKEVPYSNGITFSLNEINGELYNAVYNEIKGITTVNYYMLPIRDAYNQPIDFDKIVIPLQTSFLGFETLLASNLKAEFSDNKVRVLTKQDNSESTFVIDLNVNETEIEDLNSMINESISKENYTLAIADLYRMLSLTTHNPLEFRRIQDRVNTLSSELLTKKEEFQGILSNLENNPSALLFSHAQMLGNELAKALKNEEFANLKLDFNQKFDIISDYKYYADECVNKIEKLREISKLISDFEEKYRGKIDYAYMLRAENKAKKLLARAYDYYEEDSVKIEDYSMAISILEQIVNLYPFTRPATIARNELVSIAFLLNQKADEIAGEFSELANQYRALAKGMCEKVLNTKFTTAGGEINEYWDVYKKSWTKIAEGIITSFYEVARTENNNVDEEDDGIEEDFENWSMETWKMKEAEARETLDTFIKQIEQQITSLPEPTKIPEPELLGDDDDDDDGMNLGDDDDDDTEDE